jgi:hypothetical protein
VKGVTACQLLLTLLAPSSPLAAATEPQEEVSAEAPERRGPQSDESRTSPDLSGEQKLLVNPFRRTIYDPNRTFGEATNSQRRYFIAEVASGFAPQGHLAVLLGLINVPLPGVEVYAGYGVEANPATTLNADIRYLPNIRGWRPYFALGYSYRSLSAIDTISHNVFGEVGYKWVIGPTYHLTLAAGIRQAIDIRVDAASPLRGSDTDAQLLEEQVNAAKTWVPTAAVKLSRAF